MAAVDVHEVKVSVLVAHTAVFKSQIGDMRAVGRDERCTVRARAMAERGDRAVGERDLVEHRMLRLETPVGHAIAAHENEASVGAEG